MPKATVKVTKPKKAVSKAVKEPASAKSESGVIVYDLNGVKKKTIDLPKEITVKSANTKLLAQYVRVYLENKRQGNASTKSRGQVRGSTRKIYKQKGTGRARHGSKRAPIFIGGGITFGPKSKEFSLKINKKQKKQALFSAITLKYADQAISALDKESLTTDPKTKLVSQFLNKMELKNKKVLFVLPKLEKNNFVLATRNIPNIELVDAFSVNPYIVLKNERVIFVSDALQVFVKHFTKTNEN